MVNKYRSHVWLKWWCTLEIGWFSAHFLPKNDHFLRKWLTILLKFSPDFSQWTPCTSVSNDHIVSIMCEFHLNVLGFEE